MKYDMNISSPTISILRCSFLSRHSLYFHLVNQGDTGEYLLMHVKHPHTSTLTHINKQKYSDPPNVHLKIE